MTQRLLLLLGSNHTTTTAYHPETNGLCERQNHTLADMLSMFVNSNHTDWDELLPAITFAYNTSRQESTRLSPFYLMHGREALVPLDIALGVNPNPVILKSGERFVDPDYATSVLQNLEKARQEVVTRMRRVHIEQKKAYDVRRRQAQYAVDELVLVYKPTRIVKKSEKLLHRWHGPYVVIRQTSSVSY